MKINKKHIISGLIALSVIASAAGVTSTVLAANNSSSTLSFFGHRGQQMQNLTDAQKTDLKVKMDAVKAAIDANDYNAWVKAETAVNPNSPILSKITADTFSNFVSQQKQRETDMTARKAKQDAVKAAIDANDYNAWVQAETAVNANSPLLAKINAANFSKLVEATRLREQADNIFKDLGIDRPERGDMMGSGMHHGMLRDVQDNMPTQR
jgi:hypothetical protein